MRTVLVQGLSGLGLKEGESPLKTVSAKNNEETKKV